MLHCPKFTSWALCHNTQKFTGTDSMLLPSAWEPVEKRALTFKTEIDLGLNPNLATF